jgi:hypothetical protein
MFGRKKEKTTPQQPFQLQVLTTEYLIEGMAEGDQQLYIPGGTENWSPIVLTDVRITSVNDDGIPIRKADTFEVQGETVVAIIPLRDATTMPQYDSYFAYEEEMNGVFYIGPYLLEGTLLNVGNDYFASALLILDATIRHMNPKSKLGEIKSPHVLINTLWLHGREVK